MAVLGKDGKVTLGASAIVGMGTWTLNPGSVDEHDGTAFGDDWEITLYGIKRGGNVSFNGHYDPDDTTGQRVLENAFVQETDLTDLRFYVDSTSYWMPNQTAGYFSPSLTTGAGTPVSSIRITSFQIGLDKNGLGTINFEAKIAGSPAFV